MRSRHLFPFGFLAGRRGRVASRPGLAAVLLAAALLAACPPPPPPFALVADSDSLDFGRTYVGTTNRSAIAGWTNASQAGVTVEGILIDSGGSPFAANLGQPYTPRTIAPGRRTLFFLGFSPTAVGPASATAMLQTAATVQSVALSGEGVLQISDGDLAVRDRDLVADQALDFGNVPFPGGSAIKTFNLINASNNPFAVDGYFADGTRGFKLISPTPPFAIGSRESLVISIIFRPPNVDDYSDGITFYGGRDAANRAGTALKGSGVPRPEGE